LKDGSERRHGPVIAQFTDAVDKISSCMLVSSHTMECSASGTAITAWNYATDAEEHWHPISYRFGVIAAYCSNV